MFFAQRAIFYWKERMKPVGVFDELKARGMIAQMTHEEQIREKLNNEKVTFYIRCV